MDKQGFFNYMKKIVKPLVKEFAYNDSVTDAIVAMACLEGNYGNSILAHEYHNHFGMKCGKYWKGNSVNMRTKEVVLGQTISVNDNFRCYKDDLSGVRGFFEFIGTNRYKNLHDATSSKEFLTLIIADGYASGNDYVELCMTIIRNFTFNRNTDNFTLKANKNYMLLDNMNVRKAPSKDAPLVGHKGLSADGKKHDANKNGSLDKGTIVTCKDSFLYGSEMWLKCPSGWLCAIDGSNVYISEV